MTDPTPRPPAAAPPDGSSAAPGPPPAAGPAAGELPGAAPGRADRAALIDSLRWKKFPVLDDGFVTLVDVMGDDAAVVQAARVSYGEGTKSVSDDRGLIRYLMRHAHSTPFEMAELKFLFRIPMDAWRQQIRHRTACLAGETELYFDLPGAEKRGRRQLHRVRLDELHRRWTGGTAVRFDPERKPTHRDRIRGMKLRMCDEATGDIRHTHVRDVWESGVKPVFRVTLENGRALQMTADHRCLTADGWRTLAEATGLRRGAGADCTWRADAPAFAVNGVPAHRDRAWLADRRAAGLSVTQIADDAGVSDHTVRKSLARYGLQFTAAETARQSGLTRRGRRQTVRKRGPLVGEALENVRRARSGGVVEAGRDLTGFWDRHGDPASPPTAKRLPRVRRLRRGWSRVARIEYAGEKTTYDVAVEGPFHNFVADGFVVHNSVNEYSTRYSVAVDAAQTTDPAAWRSQAATNRQGSGDLLPADVGEALSAAEADLQARARATYEARLEAGVAREQARKDLPLSTYTEAYWKIDLHNLLHFLRLRMDPHAQKEIRDYAATVGEKIVAPLFPLTWEAFRDYRLNAALLTGPDRGVIRRLAATGRPAPHSEEAFLAAQDPAWADLKRCRERDECRAKLAALGLLPDAP